MKRVIGLGGVFFKAKDPKALYEWYRKHLGIESAPDGSGAMWGLGDDARGMNVFAIFPQDTTYLTPSQSSFMINFRVDNLDELLKALRAEGVQVDDNVGEYDFGKFGWVMDPEGNRVELWEPPKTPGNE
jgi:catechol 2,3-dioxygenase-like lactoylglutathione lyase family enzyme